MWVIEYWPSIHLVIAFTYFLGAQAIEYMPMQQGS